MAIGFTPKHIETYSLGKLSREEFLVLALDAAEQLKWTVYHLSEAGLMASTKISWSSWGAEVTVKIGAHEAELRSASTGSEMFDWGKNKKNILTYIAKIEELASVASKEVLLDRYETLKQHFVVPEQDELVLPPPTRKQQLKDFAAIFVPVKGYAVTPILININIIVFILMAIGGVNIIQPRGESLVNWGANFGPMTLHGEWWRLITCCFVHIGIMHLLLNMYALAFAGILLEPLLGTAKFLTAYLLAGILASTTSLWWNDHRVSAGASGAIFGLYGVFGALLTSNLVAKEARKSLLISIAIFVGINLVIGLKGGIDNSAHIGGLLSGLVIGYAYIPSLKRPDDKKLSLITLVVLIVLLTGTAFIVYKRLPRDQAEYEAAKKQLAVRNEKEPGKNLREYEAVMRQVAVLEEKALKVHRLPGSTADSIRVAEIRNNGLPTWDACERLLLDVQKLSLDEKRQLKIQLLLQYVALRKRSYELYAKTYEEKTDRYKQEYMDLDQQIELLIDELGGKHPKKQ